MPTYDVSAPDGKKFTIEGDHQPSESELNDIYAKVSPPQKSVPLTPIMGVGFTPPPSMIALLPAGETDESITERGAIRPEQVPSGQEMTDATGLPRALTVPISAVDKLAAGIVQFGTSAKGMTQIGASVTPAAPVVYGKWAYDMLKGGVDSLVDAKNAIRDKIVESFNTQMVVQNHLGQPPTEDEKIDLAQRLSDDAVNSAAMLLGGKAAASHAIKTAAPLVTKALAPATAQALETTLATPPKPKEPDATSDQPSTKSVPQPEVRPPVGQETPLRQQGEATTPPPQEPTQSQRQADVSPAVSVDYSPEDLAKYQELKPKTIPQTPEEFSSPEFQKNWAEFEHLRNKYNGMPPKQLAQSPTPETRLEPTKNVVGSDVSASPPQSAKFRVGNSPQLHTLVEKLPQSEVEKQNNEQAIKVKNDKTGAVSTVMESDLTPVTEKPAGEKASKSNKSLDDQLSESGLDPSVFPNDASKKAALKRQKVIEGEKVKSGGFAKPEEFSNPTIEDQISGGKLAPPIKDVPQPQSAPSNVEPISTFRDSVKNATETTKGWLGAMAGKTFPRTTLVSRQLGELGARWISSRIAARPKSEIFSAEVLGDSGLDKNDIGAALTEDNLRSIKSAFESAGETEKAAGVQSIIGKKGSPFKTEKEYQDYLSNPKFREVVERHKDMWEHVVEPQYRTAQGIDPDVELPSRGLQTGARINLRAVVEGESPQNTVRTVSAGNLLGTLRKKSPFGIQAFGSADAYHTDYYNLMENTFGKQDEIANKRAFEDKMVETGNAVIAKPGQRIIIDGKIAKAFPLKRSGFQNQMLYVNPKIESEYRIGSNVDFKPPQALLAKIAPIINKTAIASGTEATTHVMNLGSALFALPSTAGKLLNDGLLSATGRADIPVKLVKIVMKSLNDNRAQIAGLSEIGAMKEYHEPSRIFGLRQGSQLIQWMDKNVRLVLDDAYQSLAKEGLVENTETARREFVNQVGQYNMRAQPWLMGKARQIGISPFVTAGKNFNTLAIRESTFNPGVKASSTPAALALKANMLSKWIGTAALIMTANYLLTKDKGGGVGGRPGTPLGCIDTGTKDKNGRNVLINVLNITGQGRALRVTGLKGFIDSKRMGLDTSTAIDSGSRDMVNAAISPWAGPVARFAVGAMSGYSTAVNVGRAYPVVPPGTSQRLSDFKNAVINMSPIAGGIQKWLQPQNQGWWEIVKSQFPRLVPQSARPDSMTANFSEIVKKAQANDFIGYVIHASRTVPIQNRHEFLQQQFDRLPVELREKAWKEAQYRRAMNNGEQTGTPEQQQAQAEEMLKKADKP